MTEYSYITERMRAEENEEWSNLQLLASRLPTETNPDIQRLFNLQMEKWLLVKKATLRLTKSDELRIELCHTNINLD